MYWSCAHLDEQFSVLGFVSLGSFQCALGFVFMFVFLSLSCHTDNLQSHQFRTNGKHVCNFLCVNNSNLRSILHLSEIWWVTRTIFVVLRGGCLCLTQSFWVNTQIQYCQIWSPEKSLHRYGMHVQSIFRCTVKAWLMIVTERRTDGLTDRLCHNMIIIAACTSLCCAAEMWIADRRGVHALCELYVG